MITKTRQTLSACKMKLLCGVKTPFYIQAGVLAGAGLAICCWGVVSGGNGGRFPLIQCRAI